MPRNIEIKAHASNFNKQFKIAQDLSDRPLQVLHQEDIFFMTRSGRLKLRIFNPGHGELIAYERSDKKGPKSSQYTICPTDTPNLLKNTLQSALGLRGVVRKKRSLLFVDQTRIHLDEVENLGYFLELEVVMREDQTAEEGERIARHLMVQLEIEDQHLIDKAYIDLLESAGIDK